MNNMLSGLIVVVGLSLLIIIHELGHFWAAKYFGVWVEEFGLGFPPRLFKKKMGETTYSFNAIPLGGFVKMHGEVEVLGGLTDGHSVPESRTFIKQSPWKRVIIILAGVTMNFLAGWLIISSVFWLGSPPIIIIDSVVKNSPAEAAGLKSGDLILNWDIQKLITFINQNQSKEITLNIKRGNETLEITVVPRAQIIPGEGALGVILRGGSIPSQNFFVGLYNGLLTSFAVVWAIITGVYQIFITPANIVGPVGIFKVAVGAGEIGLVYVLQLLGLISLNLAVLNILPIPALDGGRLLFIIIEKIRGRAFTVKTEMRANAWGFTLLLTLILLVTVKDVAGLF